MAQELDDAQTERRIMKEDDLNSADKVYKFSLRVFPETDSANRFFVDSARGIFRQVLTSLITKGVDWSFDDLSGILRDEERLRELVGEKHLKLFEGHNRVSEDVMTMLFMGWERYKTARG